MASSSGRLAGRAAVVTGASKNIGRAIATAFASEGADLLICARGEELLEETAAAIRDETGRRVEAVVADVRDEDALDDLIARANAAFPAIDILVNNAYSNGGTNGIKLVDVERSSWDDCLRANVMAPFLLSQAFGRSMLEGGGGNIINIVATAAFMPLAGWGPYAASKSALWTITRYLAEEWAPAVRVNAISPGTISDDGDLDRVPGWKAQMAFTPMNRPGKASELAAAAVFLASDEASYMTGNLLFVDGGRGAIRHS